MAQAVAPLVEAEASADPLVLAGAAGALAAFMDHMELSVDFPVAVGEVERSVVCLVVLEEEAVGAAVVCAASTAVWSLAGAGTRPVSLYSRGNGPVRRNAPAGRGGWAAYGGKAILAGTLGAYSGWGAYRGWGGFYRDDWWADYAWGAWPAAWDWGGWPTYFGAGTFGLAYGAGPGAAGLAL